MITPTTALIADPLCRKHRTGFGHPETPARYDAVVDAITTAPFFTTLKSLTPGDAKEEDLRRCHSQGYIDLARTEIERGSSVLSSGDTAVSSESWKVALRAAGSALRAVDAVCAGEVPNAFCVVRPPGHHATPNRGMGFCIFNNVAIAARHAQTHPGIKKVLIVDWDVHHGNGTQDIFYEDGTVFYFSTHQSPWYPGTGQEGETGAGAGIGTTLNCPLPAGSGHDEIFAAFERKLLPAATNFRPDLLLISAGFDSRRDDPLGQFTLSDSDFGDLTKMMLKFADAHCGGRIVSVLEGGYNTAGLASAALAHVRALAGEA